MLKIKVTYTGGCIEHNFELIRQPEIGFAADGPQDLNYLMIQRKMNAVN